MSNSSDFEEEFFRSVSASFSEIDELNRDPAPPGPFVVEQTPLTELAPPEPSLDVADHKVLANAVLDQLMKLSDDARKYNNQKALYAIELAIADIKTISGCEQEN